EPGEKPGERTQPRGERLDHRGAGNTVDESTEYIEWIVDPDVDPRERHCRRRQEHPAPGSPADQPDCPGQGAHGSDRIGGERRIAGEVEEQVDVVIGKGPGPVPDQVRSEE